MSVGGVLYNKDVCSSALGIKFRILPGVMTLPDICELTYSSFFELCRLPLGSCRGANEGAPPFIAKRNR